MKRGGTRLMKFKYYKELLHEKFSKSNVTTFVKNQGFYIILFTCIAAVGITALVIAGRQGQSEIVEAVPELTEGLAVQNPISETLEDVQGNYEYFITENDATEEISEETTQVNTNRSSAILSLRKPIDGTILNGFSGEIVVFNESLNQWASHNAIDIEAEMGDDVIATKAGEVLDVYEDALLGGVIVLKHGGDMKSVYKNIIPDENIAVNDKVDTGQVIGVIGKSGLKEDHLGPHLHFEFFINDLAVDAEKYFN